MKTKLMVLCFLALLFAAPSFAQGVMAPPQTAFKTVNGVTMPIASATITVCAANATGVPCSPALSGTVFKDSALTQPLSNPFTADASGNYQFAAAPGQYTVTVTASGFTGYSSQLSLVSSFTGGNVANATTFLGPITVNGTANLNGGGNAAIKPAASDAIEYLSMAGSNLLDGKSRGTGMACSGAGITSAEAALPSTGGIIDALDCNGTLTVSSTVTLGGATKFVVVLMSKGGFWQCTITNATPCWNIFPGSGLHFEGLSGEQGNLSGVGVSNSASITCLLCSTISGTNRPVLDSVSVVGNGLATVSDAVVDLGNLLDGSQITGLQVGGFASTYLIKITNASGSVGPTNLFGINANCQATAGCKPVLIDSTAASGVMGAINFFGGSLTHPGSGGLAIVTLQDTGAGSQDSGTNFFGTQIESSNSTDIGFLCNGCRGLGLYGVLATAGVAGADIVKISGNAGHVVVSNLTNFNNWTNDINNTVNGKTVTGTFIENYAFSRYTTTQNNIWDDAAKRDVQIDSNGLTLGSSNGGTITDQAPNTASNFTQTRTPLTGSLTVNITGSVSIASGFGTTPSIVNQGAGSGPTSIEVNVGTGGVATSGVLTMPAAPVGWSCHVSDMNTNIVTRETAFTTTTVTLTAASAWTASDKLLMTCWPF